MANILKNDFSWSLQRLAVFKKCKREYFYHYYGSWEGWNENTEERTKLIYRLKNIKTEDVWLKSIIEKILFSAIKGDIEFTPASCKSYSIRAACKDILELERQEYLTDPKKLCLDNIYFAEETVESLRKRTISKFECFWNVLWENPLLKTIREKPYGDFVRIGSLCEFILNDIKIWLTPGIVYLEKGKKFIIDIYPVLRDENYPALSMSLSVLFIKETYKYFKEELAPRTIIVSEDKNIVIEEYLPISEISALIKKSSYDMFSYLTAEKKAHEENFPATAEKEKCRTCRFRETCAA